MKFHGRRLPRGRPRGKGRRLDLRPGEGPLEAVGDFTATAMMAWSPRANIICMLASSGMKGVEIAEALRISDQTVSNVLNDPRAAKVILEAQANASRNILDLNGRIKQHAEEALNEIVNALRTAEDPRLRVKVGFGLLDRAGYTPIQRHIVKTAPTLPEGLVERVTETHAEITQIRREFQYTAPQAAPNEPQPTGQDVSQLGTGTDG